MGPQESSITSSSGSSSSSSPCSATRTPDDHQIDQLLAGAGYLVRSSQLTQVAHRLQRLENVMLHNPTRVPQYLADDLVHYNPSDLSSWIDNLLSELNQPGDSSSALPSAAEPAVGLTGWAEFLEPRPQPQQRDEVSRVLYAVDQEEDSGIHLVHVLMTCAEAIQCGNLPLAGNLIEELQAVLARVNTACGIGKVAGYFIDALSHRIFMPEGVSIMSSASEDEILCHHFYEAAPYLKFAHFTANQAILEAFHGHDCVHVVDFNLMQGLQWPALIQALALRPGGPPLLRITGIGPPSPDGRDSLREIGLNLAEVARSVNVKFAFRGVAALGLQDIKPWMLEASPNEAIAINSILQFHKLLGSGPVHESSSFDSVLMWIRGLNPKIVTVVEQEANHNQVEFLDRFTEALYYYSTMFDSLESCSNQPEKNLAEMYIQRDICNVICCEGSDRVERHEPLAKWRARFSGAGFKPLYLGSNAFKQASMLLTLFSAEGYSVEENEGCLTLGWHSCPLIAASAWQPVCEPNSAIAKGIMSL